VISVYGLIQDEHDGKIDEATHEGKSDNLINRNYHILMILFNVGNTILTWGFFIITRMLKSYDPATGEPFAIHMVLIYVILSIGFTFTYCLYQGLFSMYLFYSHHPIEETESHPLLAGLFHHKWTAFVHYTFHLASLTSWLIMQWVAVIAYKYYSICWYVYNVQS
jgi:hypothetical protein